MAERAGLPQNILSEAAATAEHLEAFLKQRANQRKRDHLFVSHLMSLLNSNSAPVEGNTLVMLQRQCQSMLDMEK